MVVGAVGSAVSVGLGLGDGVDEGLGDGDGVSIAVGVGTGVGSGVGIGGSDGLGPSGDRRREAPTTATVPSEPAATATISSSASAWARRAIGREPLHAMCQASRTAVRNPTLAREARRGLIGDARA